jgi:hypothetical protein
MLGISSSAAAQGTTPDSGRTRSERGHFFVYVAPVLTDVVPADSQTPIQLRSDARLIHFGGGGEGAIARHFGVGTEFGGIPNATRNRTTATVFSANAYVHPLGRRPQLQLDPYITAGFSGFLSDDQKSGGFNLGGGVNWWTRGSLGVMIELRQTLGMEYREIRFGVALRQ